MEAATGQAMWSGLDLEEARAWAYRVSALVLLLYPAALLAWTVAEGRRSARGERREEAAAKEEVVAEKKRQSRARRRPWLLPVALLAAAAATAALVGRAALDFVGGAITAGAGHRAPPATALSALRVQAATRRPPAAAAGRADERPELMPSELRQLRHGLPVQRQELHGSRGTGLFVVDVRAPPAVIFGCLQSFESYPNMIPSVRGAKIHAHIGLGKGAFRVRAHYKVSRFGLAISVVHAVDAEAGTVGFDLDEAGAKIVLQEAHGSWRVEPVPGGGPNESRVWLQIRLRASKLLPRWLVDYAAERALARATSWLKPFMERLASQDARGSPMCQPRQLATA